MDQRMELTSRVRALSARLDAIQHPKPDPRNRVVLQMHDAALCVGGRSMWRIYRVPAKSCPHMILWLLFWRFRLGIKYSA